MEESHCIKHSKYKSATMLKVCIEIVYSNPAIKPKKKKQFKFIRHLS